MIYYNGKTVLQHPQLVHHQQIKLSSNGATSIPQPGTVYSPTHIYHSSSKREAEQRELNLNHRRGHDYCAPLGVETSVEYDLPSHIYPPKNAEPILMIHPDYSKKLAKQAQNNMGASLGNFLVPGSSPGPGRHNKPSNDGLVQYLNSNGKRSNKSTNSCARSCYPACGFSNSPSMYIKSSSSNSSNSRNISNSTNSTSSNLLPSTNTSNHSVRSNNSSKQKSRQQLTVQQRPTAVVAPHYNHTKSNSNNLYQPPPPSYGTATGLHVTYRQPSHASIATPRVGSVVPPELVPQMMATAHTVRSRGSPKVRTSSRRVHGVLPEYHLRRPRSNTVGAQSVAPSQAQKTHCYQQDLAANVARMQQMQQQQEINEAVRRQQKEIEETRNLYQSVSAVPYILEGRVADTATTVTHGQPTPEMMEQDPYPSRSMVSSVVSTPLNTQDHSRLLRNAEIFQHQHSDAVQVTESAKHHRQTSSTTSNRSKNIERSPDFWNFYEMIRPDIKSHHKKSNSVAGNFSHYPSKTSNTGDVKLKNLDRSILWKTVANMFEEEMASPQAIDLTSPTKSTTQFSPPSTSLLSSTQFLGVPTPPVSNLAEGPSSHFGSNTNFINNIYHLSNMNPIYNLVY